MNRSRLRFRRPAVGSVTLTFQSKLAGPPGVVLSEANLTLYREWYVTVKHHSPMYNGPPNLPITNIDTFPDALIPRTIHNDVARRAFMNLSKWNDYTKAERRGFALAIGAATGARVMRLPVTPSCTTTPD